MAPGDTEEAPGGAEEPEENEAADSRDEVAA
jgi:hypothetical protein